MKGGLMELRHLRYYLAVVDEGTTTRAAERMRVAQPSLSRQLQRLEAELRVRLFDRDGHRLRLTAAGQRFVPLARDLVAREESARTLMRSLADGLPPSVTIAAPGTTVADVIAPFIATTSEQDPLMTVREEVPLRTYPALREGADLAVSTAPPPAGLASLLVMELPVYAYPPRTYRARGAAVLGLASLLEWPLILLTPDFGTRRTFDDAVLGRGPAVVPAFETSSPQIAQALAAAGRGIAVVSDDPRYGLEPLLIDLGDRTLTITLYAAWDPTHYAAAVLDDVARRLSDFCHVRYDPAGPAQR